MRILMGAVYLGLLFLSGAAALTYQVVWQRILSQEIGIDNSAVAIVVAVFMTGLGFGSLYAGRFVRRYPLWLPVIYALLEAGIALYGYFSDPILRAGNQWLATQATPSLALDFVLNMLLLLPPVFLMGMSTPVIMDMVKRSLDRLGGLIGVFYGMNVLGAAIGSLVCGLYMIETYGLRETSHKAALINALIALLALMIAPIWYRQRKVRPAQTDAPPAPIGKRYIYASLCFGFSTLATQMILFRVMFYLYTPIPTLFPVILALYLGMMALGEYVVGKLCDRIQNPVTLQRLSYVLLLGTIVSFMWFFSIPVSLLARPDFIYDTTSWRYIATAMVPVAFLSGYLPLLLKIITRNIGDVGANFGFILGISTLGNVFGVFIMSLLLLGVIGTFGSLIVVLLVVLAGCVLINDDAYAVAKAAFKTGGRAGAAQAARAWVAQPWLVALSAALLVATVAMPYKFYRQLWPGYGNIGYIEGRTGIVTAVPYIGKEDKYVWLFNSRVHAARANLIEPDPISTWALTRLMALDPQWRPQKVMQIGLGEGIFHYAMKELPFMERVDVVEISSEVIRAWEKYTKPKALAASFHHPKVNLAVMDGRRFLRRAVAAGEKYDMIQIGVQRADASGASNIYTTEMFALAKQALKPGGYLVLIGYTGLARTSLENFNSVFWLDQEGKGWIYATDKTFEDMPDKLDRKIDPWLGKLYTAMSVKDMPLSEASLAAMKRPVSYRGFTLYLFDKEWLKANYSVNTDDRLIYEYDLLAKRSKDFKNQVAYFGEITYPSRKVEVRVSDSMQPGIVPKAYPELLGKETIR